MPCRGRAVGGGGGGRRSGRLDKRGAGLAAARIGRQGALKGEGGRAEDDADDSGWTNEGKDDERKEEEEDKQEEGEVQGFIHSGAKLNCH